MKVNGRNIIKWRTEKMRTGIYVTLIAKVRGFVYLLIKLVFRQSDTNIFSSSNSCYVIVCFLRFEAIKIPVFSRL